MQSINGIKEAIGPIARQYGVLCTQLGWELDKLLEMTLQAMAATEDRVNQEL